MSRDDLISKLHDARALVYQAYEATDLPQIQMILRHADQNLHWALWNLGVVNSLRPDLPEGRRETTAAATPARKRATRSTVKRRAAAKPTPKRKPARRKAVRAKPASKRRAAAKPARRARVARRPKRR